MLRTQSVVSVGERPEAVALANPLRRAWNLASRSSRALRSMASGVMWSLGLPNSSLPWWERIMCSINKRRLGGNACAEGSCADGESWSADALPAAKRDKASRACGEAGRWDWAAA